MPAVEDTQFPLPESNVIGPNEYQKKILRIPESFNILLAGGRGSSKSVCSQFLMIRHCEKYRERAKILYVRESWESLKQFEDELAQLLQKVFGKAVNHHSTNHMFTWQHGATIQLSQLEDEKDYSKFQGKALCDETPIPTPEGWKALKHIQVGDKVFDEKGIPCNVTDIHEVWPESAYRLTFDDVFAVDCCSEHQWVTLTFADRTADGNVPDDWANRPTVTTQDIVDTFGHNHAVPLAPPHTRRQRTITAYEEIAPKPMRCIMVDSPNHMYLCGEGMVPTHNSYTMLAVDEYGARRETKFVWLLASNMRGPKGVPTQIVLMANPGGHQHGHIHYDFIAKAPGWEPFDKEGEPWIHCPGTWRDNPHIDQAAYVRKLRQACGNDEELFKAWDTGSWNIARGAYFAGALDEKIHMLSVPQEESNPRIIAPECPFPLTRAWQPFIAQDWGSGAPCITYVVGESPGVQGFPKGSLILVDELALHEANELNVGLNWSPDKLAEGVKDLCKQWNVFPSGVGDDAYGLEDTLLNTLRKLGVYLRRPQKERVAGWQLMRNMLVSVKNRDGGPGLWITARCQYFWKTVPFLQRDPKRPEDIITKNVPDHGADAARFSVTSRGHRVTSGSTEGI